MVTIPSDITNKDRLKYLYRAVELLRLEHNAKGKQYRDGVISKKDWEVFVATSFEPRSKRIFVEINKIKEIEDMFETRGNDDKGLPLNTKILMARQLAIEGKAEINWDDSIKLNEI